MIYVMSDLHGQYEKYDHMLDKIAFSGSDSLYILGDIIDRGPDAGWILLDIMTRDNIYPLLGNHEAMLLQAEGGIEHAQSMWLRNGSAATLESLKNVGLSMPELAAWIRTWPVAYTSIRVSHANYYLIHACPVPLKKETVMKTDMYGLEIETALWYRYSKDDAELFEQYMDSVSRLFPNTVFITGHTPTYRFQIDKNVPPRKFQYPRTNVWNIDCGCAAGKTLCCVRLDDRKEFYID